MIFTFVFLLGISLLLLIKNAHLQFLGAILILILCLYLNSKYLDKVGFFEYGLVFIRKTWIHLLVGILIGLATVILLLIVGVVTTNLAITWGGSAIDNSATLSLS
jgi:hypothetical protein